MRPKVELRVLGSVEIVADGQPVPLTRPQRRAVLAYLVLNARRTVSSSELIDALWGEAIPATARAQVYALVFAVRQALRGAGADILVSAPGGYRLDATDEQVDLTAFQAKVKEAQGCIGDPQRAGGLLREALAYWHGEPLSGINAEYAEPVRVGLREAKLAAQELLAEMDLAGGLHREVVAELTALVAANPLRERLVELLMQALYRSERPAEALAAYRGYRDLLAAEHGLDPTAHLRDLELAILRGESAPGQVAPSRPNLLPADVDDFTGRAGALAQLDRGLAERAGNAAVISLLTGTAGIGKTALAVHWAYRAAQRFPDGLLYVDLHGYDHFGQIEPLHALGRLLVAMGVPAGQIPMDVDAAAALYRATLSGKKVLVVADNAADADHVRPLLPGTVGPLTIITSRDRLSGLIGREGARRVELDALSETEAVQLIAAIAGRDRVAAEPRAARDLAKVCSYLPLALRIAAAYLKDFPTMLIEEYVSGLRGPGQPALTKIAGDPSASVRLTFDRSYFALPRKVRRTFDRVSVLPGPDFGADIAGAVTAAPGDETAEHLRRLAGAHLLGRPVEGRYAFHDLVRTYAREHLTEADRREAVVGMYDWYLAGADASAQQLYPQIARLAGLHGADGPRIADAPGATAWLAAEHAGLVAAITQAPSEAGSRIWILSDWLKGHFLLTSATHEWIAVAKSAVAAAEAAGDRLGLAACLDTVAGAYAHAGRVPEGLKFHEQALEINRALGAKSGEAVSLGGLGDLYNRLGRSAEAVLHLRGALQLHRETGGLSDQAVQLVNLGESWLSSGDLPAAQRDLAEAIELCRQCGATSMEALAMNGLAQAQWRLGRPAQALATATAALTTLGTLAPRAEEALTTTLGLIHLSTHDHDPARRDFLHAIRLAEEHAIRPGSQAYALGGLAILHSRLGEVEKARALCDRAQAAARAMGVPQGIADAATDEAEVWLTLGDLDRAREAAQRALALHERLGRKHGQERAHRILEQADTVHAALHRAQADHFAAEIRGSTTV